MVKFYKARAELQIAQDLIKELQGRNADLVFKVEWMEKQAEYLKNVIKLVAAQPVLLTQEQMEHLAGYVAGTVVSALKKPEDLN